MAARTRYSLLQRLIHWAIAVVALGTRGVGFMLGFLGFDGVLAKFGQDSTNLIYKYHKSFGVLLLALMVLRLVVKKLSGRPDYVPPLAAWQRIASASVHGLLYVALLAQPLVGWAATAAGGYPIEFFGQLLPGFLSKDPELSKTFYGLHFLLGWAILGLIAVHVGAALMHWLVLRDGVMRRMSLF